jgi:GntR family transcriptional regulator
MYRFSGVGGAPVAFDHACVPLALAPGLATLDFSERSLYAVLEEAGVIPTRADLSVEAAPASDDGAALLDVEPGHPLLVTDQITFDKNGQPIELATMAYRHDRYRFRASLRRPGKERE